MGIFRVFIVVLLTSVGLTLYSLSYAQMPRQGAMQGMNPQMQNPFLQNDTQQEQAATKDPADTVKKIRKPLESYFFDDSLRKQPNFSWNVDLTRNKIIKSDIDTTMNLFQLDYPYQRADVGDVYLGNLGGATIPINYFRRPQPTDFAQLNAYNVYLMTPERAPFYNVKQPFTNLTYFWAGQKKYLEEKFNAIHAQNISPSSGMNLNYKSLGTRGMYDRQGTRNKYLSLAASHTGKKYTVHGGYIYNSLGIRENGGIRNVKDVTDTIFDLPENIQVNLKDARNRFKTNTYYLVQSYGVPLKRLTEEDFSIADRSTIFIGHSIEYARSHRKYTDTKGADEDYFENWYIDTRGSRDSTFESRLSNRVFIQLQPWDRNSIVGVLDAGAGIDNLHYYQFVQGQYLSGDTKGVDKSRYYLYGSLSGRFRDYFDWGADAQYNPIGYQAQDLKVEAHALATIFFSDHSVTISGKARHSRLSPTYWSGSYYSNHFVWFNSFSKEIETYFEGSLKIPYIGMELGAHYSIVENKIYFGQDAKPAQSTGTTNVVGLYAQEDISLGGFHLNHRILLQKSSAPAVIPLPTASAYLSYYFEFDVVKDILRVQTGFDARYNTKYYAFGYNPATAQFFNQQQTLIGGYPMVDVFVSAKWKRMRIAVKMDHLNEGWGAREYFSAFHYPLNRRVLKLGFSWSFYD